MMIGQDVESLRAASSALFGAMYRVEIGAAIAEGAGVLSAKELAQELGDPPGYSNVSAECRVLRRAGLLVPAPRQKGERRLHLIQQDSPYWELCRDIAARPEHYRGA